MTTQPCLEIEGVEKRFRAPDGRLELVLDVPTFSLGRAEQVALYGASGSGKTTFLHVIAGLVRPDAGRVVVAGHALERLSESARDRVRAEHVGYVFQSFNLLPGLSALENVAVAMHFGRGVDLREAHALLARVGLGDRLAHLPRQLSVGQQQRVAVARALANRPALILADEPTGNLDEENAAATLGLIREVCHERSAALLLVSHDRRVLEAFETRHALAQLNHARSGAARYAAGA